MANFLSEDDIEQAILNKLRTPAFGYEILVCDADPAHREDLNDGTGRASKKVCVLPCVLAESLRRINPHVQQSKLDAVIHSLTADFSDSDLAAKNYELYGKLRNFIKVATRKNGEEDFELVKLIDFDEPKNNSFTAVSQMWIQGRYCWRRPDILIFVNGLPLVFIELKNSIVKVREAYDKNLKDYLRDIPNLFAFNQICVLSNGVETRLGAFNASYDYFFQWLKRDEKEQIDRQAISDGGASADCFVNGLLHRETLVDYLENFILFENKTTKIIAMNHQFLGVNSLIESVKNRETLGGKLGVFWHTQGSGKSYSMVMFARKVRRKLRGNFTFLVITDREDLDTQVYKNFVRTEVIGNKEECQPKNGEQLRTYLQSNKPFIFTLIHKFHYDKDKKYPVLTTRDDIIVMVDEAHRTQYKDLAENMRTALPNASFIAFTGTPLLGAKRLTNKWFGNYVSEYNFGQSVEDKATVPLFYSRRVPEVGLTNDFLDDDVVEIIENENLSEEEMRLLENSGSRILEVIKRDDRLDKIARDIAHHFPRRGFLGKGMVISADKYTTVKMYDKVQHYWAEEKKALVAQRSAAKTKEERDDLAAVLAYMNKVEMAVIVSEEADEAEKFARQGLDITRHRAKMNQIIDGVDIEDRFKKADDSLQLVFVCAMWLTGFDVKSLSTLYLDKPMKGHTLMQAIARANRVYPNKPCGIIVDYINVFKHMKKALKQYASGSGGGDFPAENITKLIELIDETIAETDKFLAGIGIDLNSVLAETETLERLEELRRAYNTLVHSDNNKERFKVLTNTLIDLHKAARPEIFERGWQNEKFAPILYIHGLLNNEIDDEKIRRAKLKMGQVLDNSVSSGAAQARSEGYVIRQDKLIDLSKVDVEQLREEIGCTPYKAVEIDELKVFLEETLRRMINKNCARLPFSERFKGIVERYNAGGTENGAYYEQLFQLVADMKKENQRPGAMGLAEEELEIFDLLASEETLTKAEEQKVALSAKHLFARLSRDRGNLFVADWYRDAQPKARVRDAIMEALDADLPDRYDKARFNAKTDLLLDHFVDMAIQGYGWVAARQER